MTNITIIVAVFFIFVYLFVVEFFRTMIARGKLYVFRRNFNHSVLIFLAYLISQQ